VNNRISVNRCDTERGRIYDLCVCVCGRNQLATPEVFMTYAIHLQFECERNQPVGHANLVVSTVNRYRLFDTTVGVKRAGQPH